MLKLKLIVVCHGKSVVFTGEKISAYVDEDAHCLFINKHKENEPYEKIAAFNHWAYWYIEKE